MRVLEELSLNIYLIKRKKYSKSNYLKLSKFDELYIEVTLKPISRIKAKRYTPRYTSQEV